MRLTLLQMTQSILGALNSDEVNSISDTNESLQVAEIVKNTYFNILNRYDLSKHNHLFQLNGSGDSSQPVIMFRPTLVHKIDTIEYYNVTTVNHTADPTYKEVHIVPIKEFLDWANRLQISDPVVDTFSYKGLFTIAYQNNKIPEKCAVFENSDIIFDSFDRLAGTTLQASKTLCHGWILPEFTMSNSFTPDLQDQLFPLLLNEAKSLAFFELKQQNHIKADQEAHRQMNKLQKFKTMVDVPTPPTDAFPNYGRKH